MKISVSILLTIILFGCGNHAKTDAEQQQDSLSNASDKKVDNIIQNDDSLIKAKEKELLEKYK